MSRNILVIGNSDGIGAAVTRALVNRGDQVIGISKSPSPFGPNGPRHEVLDVTSPHYPELLKCLLLEVGHFDAVIYCAGIGSNLTLPDLSNESRVLEVNLLAMVKTVEVLVPNWLERGNGHFLGLSSIADDLYVADAPSYAASKAGFSHYLLSMGLKLKKKGIAVTNIRFGFVQTKMAKAKKKPLLITAEKAAEHVLSCLEKRPMQLTVPKLAGGLVRGLRWAQSLKIWTD